MTVKDLTDRGYKPHIVEMPRKKSGEFSRDEFIPVEDYYLSSLGLIGVYYIKGNVAVRYSLNYGRHHPPCVETIHSLTNPRLYIEVAWNKIIQKYYEERQSKP